MKQKKEILYDSALNYGSKKDWDQIIAIFKKYQKEVTTEQAQSIMLFLNNMANIIIEQIIENQPSNLN
jgi:hypothetical protein